MMTGLWVHPNPDRPKINHAEEWQSWVATRSDRRSQRPPLLTRPEYEALDPQDQEDYDLARMVANANLTLKETPMGTAFSRSFGFRVKANALSFAPGVKGGVFLSGDAGGLGKSTLMMELAAQFEEMVRSRPELFGPREADRDLWIPVVWVSLPTNVTVKGLYGRILKFYGENVKVRNFSETELAEMVRDCVQDCRTLLIVVDDITRLNMNRESHQDTADAIRELQETGATVVGVGIDIATSGLLFERGVPLGGRQAKLRTQTRRRFKLLTLEPFTYETDDDKVAWAAHLAAVEQDLLLLNHQPGDLSDTCAEKLFRATTGYLGSLQTKLDEACIAAIEEGVERITPEILDSIVADDGAEASEAQHEAEREEAAAKSNGKQHLAGGTKPGDPGTGPKRRKKNGVWNGNVPQEPEQRATGTG